MSDTDFEGLLREKLAAAEAEANRRREELGDPPEMRRVHPAMRGRPPREARVNGHRRYWHGPRRVDVGGLVLLCPPAKRNKRRKPGFRGICVGLDGENAWYALPADDDPAVLALAREWEQWRWRSRHQGEAKRRQRKAEQALKDYQRWQYEFDNQLTTKGFLDWCTPEARDRLRPGGGGSDGTADFVTGLVAGGLLL